MPWEGEGLRLRREHPLWDGKITARKLSLTPFCLFLLIPISGDSMQNDELQALFDQQAASYDQQWIKLSPLRDALHLLIGAVFAALPADARILCIGAGTGAEILDLAARFRAFRFTVVEPSARMLEVCRRRTAEHGIAARCEFHEGYLDTLPASAPFDAGTALLVSQFILARDARTAFFRAIAARLRPGGILASTDLASDTASQAYRSLLEAWLRMMATTADIAPEKLEQMRAAYDRDVAILPPDDVAAIIAAGGFDAPVRFFQAGLIHGWYARRV
jgi:tRNA (cmo5U34)-methyltransferase